MAVSGDVWASLLYAVILSAYEAHEMPVRTAVALLFDLGRVVIDIDFKRAIACWAGHARCDPRLIEERFRRDVSHRRHEVGEIDMAEYFAGLKAACDFDLSYAQFVEGWNAIFIGEMPGMAELLERAARQLPLYAFTNTNPDHEAVWSRAALVSVGHFP